MSCLPGPAHTLGAAICLRLPWLTPLATSLPPPLFVSILSELERLLIFCFSKAMCGIMSVSYTSAPCPSLLASIICGLAALSSFSFSFRSLIMPTFFRCCPNLFTPSAFLRLRNLPFFLDVLHMPLFFSTLIFPRRLFGSGKAGGKKPSESMKKGDIKT